MVPLHFQHPLILRFVSILLLSGSLIHSSAQQVPSLLNYQGRVAVGGALFTGTGEFGFALVNAGGTTTYWSNDGTSVGGGQPSSLVSLPVTAGLYSLLLGDTSVTNMTPIPVSAFANGDARLRVWFSDGTHGTQLLSPDQRIGAVGYAMVAGSVATGGSNLVLAGNTTLTGDIDLPQTTSAASGVLEIGGAPFLQDYGGGGDVFVGSNAGNFAVTGGGNSGDGYGALYSLSTGHDNTAVGQFALHSTTTGASNTALGSGALDSNTSGSDNIAIGAGALSASGSTSENVAVGDYALQYNTGGSGNSTLGYSSLEYNTVGNDNTSVGSYALNANTTGSSNTAAGEAALLANTAGYQNTASGAQSLYSNTTGFQNTASGFQALYSNTTGYENTASGYQALANNTMGYENTANGYEALAFNTTGFFNTASGFQALVRNTSGYSNTVDGFEALNYLTGGNTNVALGAFAGGNFTGNESNNIDIGNFGVQGDTNITRIGSTQGGCYIAGISGVNISGGAQVYINSNGQLGTANSSQKYKTDIKPMGESSEVLYSLKPVSFKYKLQYDSKGIPQYGLIAEEVQKVAPDLVVYDAKGNVQTVRYEQVNAMLLNEFLKEHAVVQAQQQTIQAQGTELKALAERLSAIEAELRKPGGGVAGGTTTATVATMGH